MRLQIKNFSILEDIDIEIDDFTILIGEQATGKSLICKVYFFMTSVFLNAQIETVHANENLSFMKEKINHFFINLFPEFFWANQAFSLSILNEKNTVIYSISNEINNSNNSNIQINFSEQYIEYSPKVIASNYENSIESETIYLGRIVNYIVAGRSFFSILENNIFKLIANGIELDPFLRFFGSNYEAARQNELKNKDKNNSPEFMDLFHKILKGKYESSKHESWIMQNDKRTHLINASSGQQEILPLLLILKHLKNGYNVLVEEPEAHLFPSSQKNVLDLLFLTKHENPSSTIMVTTHSPYTLTCANNNILKYQDMKVNAYVIANGRAISIIDPETNLIDGTKIDEVSEVIAEEFDRLLGE